MEFQNFEEPIEFYLQKGRLERSQAFHEAFALGVSQIKKIFHNPPAMETQFHKEGC